MAKASTYATDSTITGLDKFLGTDAADSSTKNFTITNLEAFLAGNGVLSIPAGTETLTNKTIDGDNNTITNLAHGAEVDNPSTGVHGVTGNVVGTTDTQTLTNKSLDFDANTITNNNAGNVSYNNASSGLVATNVKTAIDELDADIATSESDIAVLQSQTLSYATDYDASTTVNIQSTDHWSIMQVGGGGVTNVVLAAAQLGDMDANAIFAIQRSSTDSVSVSFSGVSVVSQAAGSYTLDNQGDIMWFIRISGSIVAVWGDFTIA